MFTQIVYTSKAIPNLSNKDIFDILRTSVEQNAKHNVTGFLLYNKGRFRQVIEGLDADIQQLYNNIKHDARHNVYITNLEIQINDRDFPMWAMGLCSEHVKPFENHPYMFSFEMFDELHNHSKAKSIQLLKEFINGKN